MRILLVLILSTLSFGIQAQEFKFGKVSKAELEEQSYPLDEEANAAYLYKYRTTYYRYASGSGLNMVTEIFERVKIYKAEGFEYATKEIPVYTGSSGESVSGIKAITYNLVDGKITESKLEKSAIFRTQRTKNWKDVKFTMPNIKEGSVIDIKYTVISPFVYSIDDYVFQMDIPTKQLHADLKILDFFKFNKRMKGFLTLNPKTESYNHNSLNTKVNKLTFDLTNIPALEEEMYVSSMDNFRSAMSFEVVSLEIPGSTYEVFSKTWEDVVKTIYESQSFGGELSKKGFFEDDLDAALAGVTDIDEKIAKILSLAKQKIKWNSYRGYSCDEGLKKAYKLGTGNIADVNLLTLAMLKHANIKCAPVLLSTRDNGIPIFPTLNGFNYVVAAAEGNDGYKLLDASDEYSAPNITPYRTLNWYGRMITDEGASEIYDLLPKSKAADQTMLQFEILDDGSIEGKCRQSFSNHYALQKRQEYFKNDQEKYVEELEQEFNGLEVSNFTTKNESDVAKTFVQSYDFYQEDQVEDLNGKLFIKPLVYFSIDKNPFLNETREYPIDYGFPWIDSYRITIKIPEGYEVESIPENTVFSLPDNMSKFKFVTQRNGSMITVVSSLSLDSALIPAASYGALREFYKMVVEKQAEKIVLRKV